MNDWESGIIHVDNEHAFYSSLTEDQLLETALYTKYFHSVRKLGNGYIWYYFDQVPLLHRHFFVSVCFKDTTLIVVEISLQGNEFPTSWDNWSEEGERKRQREHDHLLEQHLSMKPSYRQTKPYPYMEYELNWGKISSYFDPRSGNTAIAFKYKDDC
ncbi:hypothetical protein G9G63_13220 [Paenibacillus sp. EKM202P]|uniref:hypothetical protein n=1 Tax=unclassified Paenibacillus TaxID=185978 RepID=UPI0013ECD9A8|nr:MULTISPECIES: hypothetical protein [unclassified Paenibacillus]KAF6563686.1 hypothetical protein G9G63_13220 [Paenibacillus sp. EKM202P]KAF6568708.1 hypothetical protein G9G64_14805 [Paenibacillus sp. EKM207P]